MLYIMAPVINYFRDKTGGSKLLLISGFMTFYWGWFAHHPSLLDGKNVINFIFLYMLGHWLHSMVDARGDKLNKDRTRYVISYLAVAVCIGAVLFFSNESVQNIIKRLCYGYNSPVLILMSVLFFLIFTSLDFKSKIVNWIGSSVFAVYCVHENQYFFRDEWYAYFEEQYLSETNFFPLILLGLCACLFILSILFDKIRNIITLPLVNSIEYWVNRYYDKLTSGIVKRGR